MTVCCSDPELPRRYLLRFSVADPTADAAAISGRRPATSNPKREQGLTTSGLRLRLPTLAIGVTAGPNAVGAVDAAYMAEVGSPLNMSTVQSTS